MYYYLESYFYRFFSYLILVDPTKHRQLLVHPLIRIFYNQYRVQVHFL